METTMPIIISRIFPENERSIFTAAGRSFDMSSESFAMNVCPVESTSSTIAGLKSTESMRLFVKRSTFSIYKGRFDTNIDMLSESCGIIIEMNPVRSTSASSSVNTIDRALVRAAEFFPFIIRESSFSICLMGFLSR